MKNNLKILFLFFFILISACGFKPILIENTYNFTIKVKENSGNKEINSQIENKLGILNGKSKSFMINLNSEIERNILSKNSLGDPTIFEIVIDLNYKLIENNKLLVNKNLTERSTYNNISDKFELNKSEKILKENLIENFVTDIISTASDLVLNPMVNDN